MKTKIVFLLAAIACLPTLSQASGPIGVAAGPGGAIGNPATRGTDVRVSTASNCTNGCTTSGGGQFAYNSDGGLYHSTADTTENSYANARAYASLGGSNYIPTLRVETIAGQGVGAFATAFAVQEYTYSGIDNFEFVLDYNLHGSVGTNPTGRINNNQLRADIAIMVGPDLDWYPDWATEVYEAGYALDSVTDSLFISDGIDVNLANSMSFILNDGDTFFIVAEMSARSIDGYADGWGTFTMNFQDDTGLVAASAVSAVPVPAAVWLFGSGILALAGIARRKA